MKTSKRSTIVSKLKGTRLLMIMALLTGFSVFIYMYQWDTSMLYKIPKGGTHLQTEQVLPVHSAERLKATNRIITTTRVNSKEKQAKNQSTEDQSSLSKGEGPNGERRPNSNNKFNGTKLEKTQVAPNAQLESEANEGNASEHKKQPQLKTKTGTTSKNTHSVTSSNHSQIVKHTTVNKREYLKQLLTDESISDEHKKAILSDIGLLPTSNNPKSRNATVPNEETNKNSKKSTTSAKTRVNTGHLKGNVKSGLDIEHTESRLIQTDFTQTLNNSIKVGNELRERVKEMKNQISTITRDAPKHVEDSSSKRTHHKKKSFKPPNFVRNQLLDIGRNGMFMNNFMNNKFVKPGRYEDFAFASNVTVRPEVCRKCFNNDFKILINEPGLCMHGVKTVILIASSLTNHESRNAIRKTWGAVCNTSNSTLKCVFVFGNRNKSDENTMLLHESKTHHDIIQFDFHDSYVNLTYKTMTSLRWAAKFCQNAQYVMKTDDDMYINTDLLPALLQAAPKSRFLGGFCWGQSQPHRDTSSKWYVSFQQYTGHIYPQMCSGTGYIMTKDVVKNVLKASTDIPFFYLEDVYLALCIKKIGVRPMKIQGFNNMLTEFSPCQYKSAVITSHGLTATALQFYWHEAHEAECPPADYHNLFIANAV